MKHLPNVNPTTAGATASPGTDERWYRLPVVWLGAAIFFASIAGCISMVILASRYPDEPLPVHSEKLLRMPAERTPEQPQ